MKARIVFVLSLMLFGPAQQWATAQVPNLGSEIMAKPYQRRQSTIAVPDPNFGMSGKQERELFVEAYQKRRKLQAQYPEKFPGGEKEALENAKNFVEKAIRAVASPPLEMPEAMVDRFWDADAARFEVFRRHATSGEALSPEEFAEVKPGESYGEYLEAYDYARAVGQYGRLSIPLDARARGIEKRLVQGTYNETDRKYIAGELSNLQTIRDKQQNREISQPDYERFLGQWLDGIKNKNLEAYEIHVPTTEETFQQNIYTDSHGVRRQKIIRNGQERFDTIDPEGSYIDANGIVRNRKLEAEAQWKEWEDSLRPPDARPVAGASAEKAWNRKALDEKAWKTWKTWRREIGSKWLDDWDTREWWEAHGRKNWEATVEATHPGTTMEIGWNKTIRDCKADLAARRSRKIEARKAEARPAKEAAAKTAAKRKLIHQRAAEKVYNRRIANEWAEFTTQEQFVIRRRVPIYSGPYVVGWRIIVTPNHAAIREYKRHLDAIAWNSMTDQERRDLALFTIARNMGIIAKNTGWYHGNR